MKYADDPFWVNLRWFMFVLFWAMWLGMLAGAITIIIKAPNSGDLERDLPLLQSSRVQGVFIEVPTYDALDTPDVLDRFKAFVDKAKEYSIK
ncbi:putative CD98hc amino acid transporter protein [Operophtera brumata]|uniref:Putative CD98hc amino acid transporter protein n=1 Tax=Operophtera brumata TaxID=104452 RepID=A0A0L7LTT6_OPEBR|nr:putative CD98hc amino acid transporter protein [Operophtera brumata]